MGKCGILLNQKEAKDHGEGGSLVGHKLRDGSGGDSRRCDQRDIGAESVPMLKSMASVDVSGCGFCGQDGEGQNRAECLRELHDEFGMKTFYCNS